MELVKKGQECLKGITVRRAHGTANETSWQELLREAIQSTAAPLTPRDTHPYDGDRGSQAQSYEQEEKVVLPHKPKARRPVLLLLDEHGEFFPDALLSPASPAQVPAEAGSSSESGLTLKEAILENGVVVVLGDSVGLAHWHAQLAESIGAEERCSAVRKISLGPVSLLGSQCIVLFHHCLDCL